MAELSKEIYLVRVHRCELGDVTGCELWHIGSLFDVTTGFRRRGRLVGAKLKMKLNTATRCPRKQETAGTLSEDASLNFSRRSILRTSHRQSQALERFMNTGFLSDCYYRHPCNKQTSLETSKVQSHTAMM